VPEVDDSAAATSDAEARDADLVLRAAGGETLAAALRARLPERSWSAVRRICASGKVSVDGAVTLDPALRLRAGQEVALRWNVRAPEPPGPAGFRLVHEDAHLVIIEKPEGVSSVPYERKETGTAMDLVRDAWRRQGRRATVTPLYVVHRIDKDTSGLLCFAKTRLAERGLHHVFQRHLADREYVAVAHGRVPARLARVESWLIPNRGDGLRGSARFGQDGQRAVTHIRVEEALAQATLCRVRLETGRTHQIRIHLSEAGHPLVGETVYIRDYLRAGRSPLPSRRLLLHAATLGFDHPVTGARLHFAADLPPDFVAEVERLRRAR
jgi:23S rRNA pseudouridine1911/1915/1917 synthase